MQRTRIVTALRRRNRNSGEFSFCGVSKFGHCVHFFRLSFAAFEKKPPTILAGAHFRIQKFGIVFVYRQNMKHHLSHIPLAGIVRFLALCAFCLLCISGTSYAQDSTLIDRNLALLRGSWQYHTFEDKWTLEFISDHALILDRNPVDYTVVSDSIVVRDGDQLSSYYYRLVGNQLSLILPDGTERKYSRDDYGESEAQVGGQFFIKNSPSSYAMISLNGMDRFSIVPDSGNPRTGAFRVEDQLILLTFDDGTVGEAEVTVRDDDGNAVDLVYLGNEYETVSVEQPYAYQPPWTDPGPDPTPIPDPPYPPYPPSPPPPQPPSPPTTPNQPAQVDRPTRGSTESKSTKDDSPPRDFGTTRGTAPRR
ncbi:MAG TPA: hypothetical protein VLY03_00170 [Bacteroidota bacterium]|nr:hypothetical protein [Bacteroidota bacterium]